MISAIAMSLILLAGLGVFAWLVIPRFAVLKKLRADDRTDQTDERINAMLRFAFFQKRLPREPIAGIAHIFIFTGFLVVALATVTHYVRAFVPGFNFPGFGGQFGLYYMLVKDIFEALVLVGAIYGIWRRLKPVESRVGRSWEGVFVLFMIVGLMLTDYLVSGGELVVSGHSGLPYNPGGWLATFVLAPLGADGAHLVGQISYWVHCVGVLVFLNFLPIGKHFHVITGIPNVYFKNLKPSGYIEKIDMEDEEAESFGLRSTADLTWKMAFDTYSCTECGRCTVYCPTALTDKPLSQKELNKTIKGAIYTDMKTLLKGTDEERGELATLVGGAISLDTLWACTTCGSCEQECPLYIENVPRIIEMRQHQVLMEGEMSPELARSFKGLENNYNPWGIGSDKRADWAEGLDIPLASEVAKKNGEVPLLYFIGCAGSFDDRNKKITLAMIKILKAAGVEFAILGEEEKCCGDPARRSGNEYLFQMLATENVEMLNNYKVKKILTHCPHCMHSLQTDYPQFGGEWEIVHHTDFIDDLIKT
ncbi:(Fe-S)-binding protein, partial [Myxococcota bacterium]|nr:(Fe-S)-binding protein [Myxococcota bacterium]